MEQPSTMESILIGLIGLLVIFWVSPGIKTAIERSKQTEADWGAVLLPLSLVVLFVVFLILAT